MVTEELDSTPDPIQASLKNRRIYMYKNNTVEIFLKYYVIYDNL